MADGDLPSPAGAPAAVEGVVRTTSQDVLHFVEVLCEWLVPLIGLILGLFIGPKIFSGNAVGDALWNLGIQSVGATGGANVALAGTLVGAGIVGVAAGSLWHYQEGRKGWTGLISRAFAGFAIGWALGILVVGLNAYFVTGNTTDAALNGWLDGAINAFSLTAVAAVPKPSS